MKASTLIGHHTVFYVRDNGIGIPEKHFEAIFRIFKRLHARDEFGGGTGRGPHHRQEDHRTTRRADLDRLRARTKGPASISPSPRTE